MKVLFGQIVVIFVAFSLATGITSAADLTEGLVAFWPMNGNAVDTTGNGHDGTVNGAQFVQDAERGTVLSVDGSSAFVEVDHADDIAFTDVAGATMSLALWVKPAVAPNPGWHSILVKNRDVHYDNSFGLWQNTGYYHFRFGNRTFNADGHATEEWKLLVLTYDGPSTTMKGYVNNQLINTIAQNPGSLGETTLMIGAARNHEGAHSPFEFFAGMIDDVAIYSRVLDQAEIDDLAGGEKINLAAVEPAHKLATTWGTVKGH
jgi:hypothetical protein